MLQIYVINIFNKLDCPFNSIHKNDFDSGISPAQKRVKYYYSFKIKLSEIGTESCILPLQWNQLSIDILSINAFFY